MTITLLSQSKSYEGYVRRYSHKSECLACEMKFHVYVPPKSDKTTGVLWFLSGLTCTDENFIQKSGAIQFASDNNLFLVCPDTSPRGIDKVGQEEWVWSGPGFGAGYYLDSTTNNYKTNFNMFTYITKELYSIVNNEFGSTIINSNNHSIMGHSMGGLGAINCFLKTNGQYKSVSGFSPISNPTECDWAKKPYRAYLGDDENTWKQYDPCYLISQYNGDQIVDIMIDQGSADEFIKDLKFEKLVEIAKVNPKVNLISRLHEGYNHGYFFISTFIKDHIEYHAKHLKN